MLKVPRSFEDLIVRLTAHNIAVSDTDTAKEILARVNYYRLSGYALTYRKTPSDSDCMDGTTLFNIYSLYCFDADLRTMLRKYLEIAEVYYKTQIGHWFSILKCSQPPHNQHYDRNNYYRKAYFDGIIESLNRESNNFYKDSLIVKHHKSKYGGEMPLWVMLELLSFSNTSKLFSAMYVSDQARIAAKIGISEQTLANHLHCLSVLRNKCAHGARLYNTALYPSARFSTLFLQKNPQIKSNSVFAYILVLMRRLPTKEDRQELFENIKTLLMEYEDVLDLALLGFPDNYEIVLKNSI